jgi:hypothetical protein
MCDLEGGSNVGWGTNIAGEAGVGIISQHLIRIIGYAWESK